MTLLFPLNSIENEKFYLFIYWTSFFYQLINNFLALLLLCKMNVLDIFNMPDYFKFLIVREIQNTNSNKFKLIIWNERAIHP